METEGEMGIDERKGKGKMKIERRAGKRRDNENKRQKSHADGNIR